MPQGLTVPAWYNDNYYINEKVDECNAIKFGQTEGEEFTPWTADTVRDFMAGVHDEASYAPWMGYDNFVTNGNDEFCSPNPLFNVMQYLYAKADQLNALNDGAGYGDNANNWTGQLVLDFFKANNISAWDHFTTSGQFEGINPSNAMDLSEFLDKKAAQCNEMEFDGKSDWTPETVLDYYQEHAMNPVMVAVNDRDPNVVAVPEDEAVTVPAGLTPWGPAGSTLVEVYLDKGADDVTDNGVPTNFIGTIETSNSNSTFTSDDKITGTNDADVLTVTMAQPFGGMRNGFVTGVPTVDLVSNAASDVTFNTKGITGVETYNVNGQITLAELAETGIAVNLSNIYEQQGVGITFADGVAQGPNDSLKLGVENVYFPDPDHQPSGSVAVNSPNIEDLSITSNGVNRNILNLDQVGNLRTLTVDGDCALDVSTNNQYLKSVDASAATGNVKVSNGNSQITDAKFGTGNDTLSTNNLLHNATVDGGEGEDTLVIVGANTTYDLNMTNVETLTINENQATVTVEGGNISGLKTLKLDSTNSGIDPVLNNGRVWDDGYRLDGRQIILSDYNEGPLTVQAVNYNNANVRIADVQEVTVHVGDGVKNNGSDVTGMDEFRGSLTLGSANTLTVNVNDTDDTQALFRSLVTGDQVSTLNLNVATDSELTFRAGSELSALSTINATGFGEISLGGQGSVIGTKASAISVNTSGMNNGSFTAVFENSEMDGKTLVNVDGSNMVDNNISVDNTFKGVSMQAGAGDDTLTLVGNNEYSKNDYRADLGDGYNTLIVTGIASGDLSNIKGVDRYVFKDMTSAQVLATFGLSGDNVSTLDGYPIVVSNRAPFADAGTEWNDTFKMNVSNEATSVKVGGAGGNDTFQGQIDAANAVVNLVAQDASALVPGALNVAFANAATDTSNDLEVLQAKDISVEGGALQDSITGALGSASADGVPTISGNVHISTGAGNDNVSLTNITAGGVVTLASKSTNSSPLNFGDIIASNLDTTGLQNTGDVAFGTITLSGSGVISSQNDGNFATGAINSKGLQFTGGNDGNLTIASVDAAVDNVAGDVQISAQNQVENFEITNGIANANNVSITANNSGTTTLGAITVNNNGIIDIAVNGGGDVAIGNLAAPEENGQVKVITSGDIDGSISLAGITTGGSAEVYASSADSASLTAANIAGALNYVGTAGADNIGSSGTAAVVGLNTSITAGNGANNIYISNTADESGSLSVRGGSGVDTIQVTADNTEADCTTTVTIDAGAADGVNDNIKVVTNTSATNAGHVVFDIQNFEATDSISGFTGAIDISANYDAIISSWGIQENPVQGTTGTYNVIASNKAVWISNAGEGIDGIYLATGLATDDGSDLVKILGTFDGTEAAAIATAAIA